MSRNKTFGLSLLLVIVVALSFVAGYTLGARPPTTAPGELDAVVDVWNIIFEDYVEPERLDAGELSEGAIQGMMEVLDDPHSAYLDAEAYKWLLESIEGKYEGIGAHVAFKDGQIIIAAPIPDTPAAEAGIRAGDRIMKIDGQSTEGMSLEEAVIRIRGTQGTTVSIHILHEGSTEPELVEIVRAEIDVPSVYFEMKESIAYIHINRFSETTAEELAPVIHDVSQGTATGIILDLRSNGGGLVQAVVYVASYFLDEGVVLYIVDRQGEKRALNVLSSVETTDLPMVVLVDGYSASGSEVLAGALQDYGRATVAGQTTFGKGSANDLRELGNGAGLYITTARWLTPNGRLIEGEGLHPDYELDLAEVDAVQWAVDYLTDGQQTP
jgi:carboxyl-terminal processing protease